MMRDFSYKLMALLCTAVMLVACSTDDEQIATPDEVDATGTTRSITVQLVPEDETRTMLTLNAGLKWKKGDKVAFFTSEDGKTWSISREATIDETTGSFVARQIPAIHTEIRIVYPSPGEGKEYTEPQVSQMQTVSKEEWANDIDDPLGAEGKDCSMMSGMYLPMEVLPTSIPKGNMLHAKYKVKGAVVRFNISVPNDGDSYGIKAIKAGNHLFYTQVDWDAVDNYNYKGWQGIPIDPLYDLDYYNEHPFCIVLPLGENIDYTPTVYVQAWGSDNIPHTKQYRRKEKKTQSFTAKAYDITLNITDASMYEEVDGWHDVIDDEPFRYGKSKFSEHEKRVYDYTVEKLTHFEANAGDGDIYHLVYLRYNEVGYLMTFNNMMNLLERIIHDVPEAYILSSYVPYSNGDNTYAARVNKVWSPEQYAQDMATIDAICDDLLKDIAPWMSDFEKVKIAYDGLASHSHYGGMSDPNSGNMYGGFIQKRAVCEGLARTFQYLCQKAGVNCMYVSGSQETSSVDNTWGNHAWTYVQVDGQWYMVDPTPACSFPGSVSYASFLLGQKSFDKQYSLLHVDGTDPNSCYGGLPTLSETNYKWK